MDGVWKNTSDGKVVLDCDNISEKISDNGTDESKKYIRTIFFTDELKNNNIDNQVKISYYETYSTTTYRFDIGNANRC